MTLSEISRLSINTNLVALISCGSGLGDKEETEAFMGLARGLFAAGARRLLVSLYPVNLDATADLMTTFSQDLIPNVADPASALQHAMIHVRTTDGGYYSNPMYWAGFEILAPP